MESTRSVVVGRVAQAVVVGVSICCGAWIIERILDRLLARVGQVVSDVATATGTSIGGAMGEAFPDYTPREPADGEAMTALRLEALMDDEYPEHAVDPTYDLLPTPGARPMTTVLPMGESLIPNPVTYADDTYTAQRNGHRP